MVEQLDSYLHSVGPAGYVVLFLAAMLEYVFPPFPGDTVTLLGGVYAVRGERPWPAVLAAVTLGSVLGSALDFALGRKLASGALKGSRLVAFLGLTPDRLDRVTARMHRSGALLLVLNRFIPAARALVFVAAGAAGLPFGRTIALGAASAVAWNVLVLAAGLLVGGNVERLEGWLARYNGAVYVLLGGVALLLVGRAVVRRVRGPGRQKV